MRERLTYNDEGGLGGHLEPELGVVGEGGMLGAAPVGGRGHRRVPRPQVQITCPGVWEVVAQEHLVVPVRAPHTRGMGGEDEAIHSQGIKLDAGGHNNTRQGLTDAHIGMKSNPAGETLQWQGEAERAWWALKERATQHALLNKVLPLNPEGAVVDEGTLQMSKQQ